LVESRTLVQTFGIYETKRSGTLRSSCGENCIPNYGRRFVSNTKLSQIERTFLDPMREFNAGDGDRGAPKALQSKHWTQTKSDRSMVLFEQIDIWHV
jgi:hypothetical protein